MNNSNSQIHLTKFCQAQAEPHDLQSQLPQLKGNKAHCLNGIPTAPAVRVGEARNEKFAPKVSSSFSGSQLITNIVILSLEKEESMCALFTYILFVLFM